LPRAEKIQQMFSGIVKHYDLLNRLLSMGRDRKWRRALVNSLGSSQEGFWLDLCCGTGDVAHTLLEAKQKQNLVAAVDFSMPMCRAAKEKLTLSNPGSSGWSVACADALNLPFAGGVFDCVTVAFGVRNFAKLKPALAEIARVTKAGGRLGVLEFAPPEGALLRLLYRPYLQLVPPLIGKVVAGNPAAYSYLSSSIESFLRPEAMLEALESAGFQNPRARKLTLGVTYLYTAQRREKA